jgi:DNA-binding CsgD family transcriptional regulator/mannose-6-phosphate isomerase-like protein (cupin superfamily)
VRSLSETQIRVIGLLVGGRTNAEIAAETGLSPHTVKWHLSQLLSKLGLRSRDDLADWWRSRHGVARRLWLEPEIRALGERPRRKENAMSAAIVLEGATTSGFEVAGTTLAVQEWQGSAPGELHLHRSHDIAWHVLEGSLHFRFADREVDAGAGSTVFIPAGTPHTYGEGDARYLVIGHPQLFELFQELRNARAGRPHTDWGNGPDSDIYRRYDSELLE